MSFTTQDKDRGGTRSMFFRLRKRFTYTNVAMTLALVFAMTGGAYAASKYLITSTKQIKPSVLKQLQGKAGPAGPAGAPGAPGEKGAPGAPGTNGTNGKNGEPGKEGKAGESVAASEVKVGETACNKLGGARFTLGGKETFACNGVEGAEGQAVPCTVSGTLPSGKTESGMWSFTAFAFEGSSQEFAISFPCPLATSISGSEHIHFIPEKGTPPSQCPGTVSEPKAISGNLCIYEAFSHSATFDYDSSPSFKFEESGLNGIILVFGTGAFPELTGTGAKLGELHALGSWAVTA